MSAGRRELLTVLTDGSRVIGTSRNATIRIQTVFGKIDDDGSIELAAAQDLLD